MTPQPPAGYVRHPRYPEPVMAKDANLKVGDWFECVSWPCGPGAIQITGFPETGRYRIEGRKSPNQWDFVDHDELIRPLIPIPPLPRHAPDGSTWMLIASANLAGSPESHSTDPDVAPACDGWWFTLQRPEVPCESCGGSGAKTSPDKGGEAKREPLSLFVLVGTLPDGRRFPWAGHHETAEEAVRCLRLGGSKNDAKVIRFVEEDPT